MAAPLIRQPAVAGTFYPGRKEPLEEVIDGFLQDAASAGRASGPTPKAIVAPHAGYVYSGPVAASAYATLRGARERVHRVVLLGPSHRVALRGLAVAGADAFLTPLGRVPIDREARERVVRLPQVCVDDAAHAHEHSLEVHLPFLQRTLGDFLLLPLAVGDASADEVAEVLEELWGGPETLIVVSSDLSHYHDTDAARRLDEETRRAIEAFLPDALDYESACGRVPLGGLLVSARRHGLEVETLDLRNSGDTAGPKDRVVGYGAWVFREPQSASAWDESFDDRLVGLARRAIAAGPDPASRLQIDPAEFPEALREVRASFVTLKQDGRLRGCIGSLEAARPLVEDVAQNAWRAAYHDPRFAPLAAAERDGLEISISVLSPSERLSFASEDDLVRQLRPGVDGLILRDGQATATFLPDVWESLPDPRDFLAELKRKAGLPPDGGSNTLEASRYTTRRIPRR